MSDTTITLTGDLCIETTGDETTVTDVSIPWVEFEAAPIPTMCRVCGGLNASGWPHNLVIRSIRPTSQIGELQ